MANFQSLPSELVDLILDICVDRRGALNVRQSCKELYAKSTYWFAIEFLTERKIIVQDGCFDTLQDICQREDYPYRNFVLSLKLTTSHWERTAPDQSHIGSYAQSDDYSEVDHGILDDRCLSYVKDGRFFQQANDCIKLLANLDESRFVHAWHQWLVPTDVSNLRTAWSMMVTLTLTAVVNAGIKLKYILMDETPGPDIPRLSAAPYSSVLQPLSESPQLLDKFDNLHLRLEPYSTGSDYSALENVLKNSTGLREFALGFDQGEASNTALRTISKAIRESSISHLNLSKTLLHGTTLIHTLSMPLLKKLCLSEITLGPGEWREVFQHLLHLPMLAWLMMSNLRAKPWWTKLSFEKINREQPEIDRKWPEEEDYSEAGDPNEERDFLESFESVVRKDHKYGLSLVHEEGDDIPYWIAFLRDNHSFD